MKYPTSSLIRDVSTHAQYLEDHHLRDKRQALLNSVETPLLVYGLETLQESEYEGVAEAADCRQPRNDGLGKQHIERSRPRLQDIPPTKFKPVNLVRAVDVFDPSLPSFLGLSIQYNGGPGLRHEQKVDELGSTTRNELNPEDPW